MRVKHAYNCVSSCFPINIYSTELNYAQTFFSFTLTLDLAEGHLLKSSNRMCMCFLRRFTVFTKLDRPVLYLQCVSIAIHKLLYN
jgi:hypothetical protein